MTKRLRKAIQEAIELLRYHRARKAESEDSAKTYQDEAIAGMKGMDVKSFSYEAEGQKVKATLVSPTKLVPNEAGLKKALGTKLWQKVSTRTLDIGKLEALMAAGEIDPSLVAQYFKDEPKGEYLRITVRDETKGRQSSYAQSRPAS